MARQRSVGFLVSADPIKSKIGVTLTSGESAVTAIFTPEEAKRAACSLTFAANGILLLAETTRGFEAAEDETELETEAVEA